MFSREFKTGAVVLIAAFILYYGTNFLKGNDFFKKGIEVYSVYDKTGGILKSQKVTINGFSIAHANALPKLNPTDKHTINPGPAVEATASISFMLLPLF